MTEQSKTKVEEPKATHNPLTIPWPTDPQGVTAALKRGGIEAARRVSGDPERLKRFKRVLRLLSQHADARFAIDTEHRAEAKANAAAAVQRIEARNRRILERDLEAVQAKAGSIKAQIEEDKAREDARKGAQ